MSTPKFKRPLRKILRLAAFVVAGITAFAALYFGAAWCFSHIVVPGEETAERHITLYIKSNGAHTDIVMPVREPLTGIDWSGMVDMTRTISRDTTFTHVAIGWGDRAFFLDMPTWDDLTLRLAFNAAFGLNTTAMHTTFYHAWELSEGELCRSFTVSSEQYERLTGFIAKRFALSENGSTVPIETDAQYGTNDCFYVARGRYNLFYTCNTWANRTLAAAGQRHCLWTIFDEPILRLYY